MLYHLAQINVARIKGVSIEDPIMKEFVDNLDRVNKVAENTEGFVWRLKDEGNNATSFNPYNDEQVIINISVWETIEALEHFVYQTLHTDFLKRRKEWFTKYGKANMAMWWIPKGMFPSIEDSVERLDLLQNQGPSMHAFDFRKRFNPPEI